MPIVLYDSFQKTFWCIESIITVANIAMRPKKDGYWATSRKITPSKLTGKSE